MLNDECSMLNAQCSMLNAQCGFVFLAFAKGFASSNSQCATGSLFPLSKMPFSRGERSPYGRRFAEIHYALCTRPNAIKSRYTVVRNKQVARLKRIPEVPVVSSFPSSLCPPKNHGVTESKPSNFRPPIYFLGGLEGRTSTLLGNVLGFICSRSMTSSPMSSGWIFQASASLGMCPLK